jgi:stage IV sporulation protein FB
MQKYFRLGKFNIFGAPVYVHWSVLAMIVLIIISYWQSPIIVAIAFLSYLAVILVHEIGHAAVAHKMGYRIFALRVALIHGVCECEAPNYELDEVKIAWGGVLAQIIISILVFTVSGLGADKFTYFGPILVFLGYFSLLIIPYNLIPSRGLDGYKAWRIIPLSYKHIKAKSALKKKLNRDRKGR